MQGKEEDLINDYLNYVTIENIKKKYLTSYENISKICKKNNIWNQTERTKYMAVHSKDHIRDMKHNPFEDLNNPNVQYWIGMLATDGSLTHNKITLGLDSKDEEHIIKYKSFLKSNLKLITQKNKKYGSSMSIFQFSSPETYNFLNSIGLTKNKTFTLKLNIPITWDLLRGIIDGDGCISSFTNKKSKKNTCCISITSASDEFVKQIYSFLIENGIRTRVYKYRNAAQIHVCNFCNCKQLINKLYTNANTYLQRKYLKAQLISNYKLKIESKFREPALGILSETHINIENN